MPNKLMKKLFPGISWRNPILNLVFKIIDPIDYLARVRRHLDFLPRYSIRVRSNGVYKQFGGSTFVYYGKLLAGILQEKIGVTEKSRILEIGCGCGRAAIGLASVFDRLDYTGIDIDRVSLEACLSNPILKAKGYKFGLMDVYNFEYNPQGSIRASTYTFPYSDESFDIVFLVSVFTHMLAKDVIQYIQEISRILKIDGKCMLTTFLLDYGINFEKSELSFNFSDGISHYTSLRFPEKTVGYYQDFFNKEFNKCQMELDALLLGEWRRSSDISSVSGFSQDILIFRKKSSL